MINEVFLSATAKDLADPRVQVQETLRLIETDVILQEEWVAGAATAYDLSLERLAQADAYLGIFGYRYGWTPPNQFRSITELECERAISLWGTQTVPPIFWFLPEAGSDAASLLYAAAVAVLGDEFPGDQALREESLQKQRAFHERLCGSARFVNSFTTLQALRDRAQAAVSNWNKVIYKRAASGRRSGIRSIPPSDLGAIGRDAQRDGLEAVMSALDESTDPGVCFACHGTEDSGQFEFLLFLEQRNVWEIDAQPHWITPANDRTDAGLMSSAALKAVDPLHDPAKTTINDLAAVLVDPARIEPVVLFVMHVTRLARGIEGFHEDFWVPLMVAARARRQLIAAPCRPFILVIALSAPLHQPPSSMVQVLDTNNPAVDVDRIVLLPELGPLTPAQVSNWLYTAGVQSLKERKLITDRVIGDGAPRAVFGRLNEDGFWFNPKV